MREKKDFDVSFNTTLSDVSLKQSKTKRCKKYLVYSDEWSLSNVNFREKAVKASMLSRRKNFLKRQKTTQSWGTILMMIACLRIIQIEITLFSYGAHTSNEHLYLYNSVSSLIALTAWNSTWICCMDGWIYRVSKWQAEKSECETQVWISTKALNRIFSGHSI